MKLLTNISVTSSVLGITDSQNLSLPNISQHLTLSAFLNSLLTQGTTHLLVGLVFCFLPGLPFFRLCLKFFKLCSGLFYLTLPDARWLQPPLLLVSRSVVSGPSCRSESIVSCALDIAVWLSHKFLKLNMYKIESLLFPDSFTLLLFLLYP